MIGHTCDPPSAVLDVIEDEKLTEHAKKVGQHLVDRLTKLQEKHKVKCEVMSSFFKNCNSTKFLNFSRSSAAFEDADCSLA